MRASELNKPITALNEGGNVFKDSDGKNLTRNINKNEILPTLKWLESITGLSLIGNTLGSVGKKEISKDLDVAVDINQTTQNLLIKKLQDWVIKQGEDPKSWVKPDGSKTVIGDVNFRAPIKGDPANGFVQVDFMFHTDLPWLKYSMYSPGDHSQFSGAERNQILSSIAKANGLKYSWKNGLLTRDTESLVSNNPDEIADKLLGSGRTVKDLYSVETIISAVKKDPETMQALKTLVVKLTNTDGKKPYEAKSDAEEAQRIKKAFS